MSVVDNCFCTPALQRPFEFGVDVVIHSATKYLDGQGRVLGGGCSDKRSFAISCCRCCVALGRVCRPLTPGCC